jgi:hypothetical protein
MMFSGSTGFESHIIDFREGIAASEPEGNNLSAPLSLHRFQGVARRK